MSARTAFLVERLVATESWRHRPCDEFFMSSDEDLEPYEREVRNENFSKQKRKSPGGPKATIQSKLPFTAAKKPATDDEDSSGDDDDDFGAMASFSFAQHKKSAVTKESKMSSLLADEASKASKKSKTERILLRTKYPRGKKPLPEGWDAREYKDVRNGKEGQPYWLFSHAYYGETKEYKDMLRSEAEWREVLKSKGGKAKAAAGSGGNTAAGSGSTAGSSASASGSASAQDADGEHGAADAQAEDLDPLAALLNKRQRKEQEDEEKRERVSEEMRLRMDTGVRVNEGLKKMYGGKK